MAELTPRMRSIVQFFRCLRGRHKWTGFRAARGSFDFLYVCDFCGKTKRWEVGMSEELTPERLREIPALVSSSIAVLRETLFDSKQEYLDEVVGYIGDLLRDREELLPDNLRRWGPAADFAAAMKARAERRKLIRAKLIADLRSHGIKLLHPNDGWVTRKDGKPVALHPCYPDFDDNPEIGDWIALGSMDRDALQIYRVTEKGNEGFLFKREVIYIEPFALLGREGK